MKLKNIITNKYILYTIMLVALMNVIGFITIRDYNSLIFFFVIALLSSYFSKNMTVNLLVAVLGTNVLFANNRLREGLTAEKGKCSLNKGAKEPKKPCLELEENECTSADVCSWSTKSAFSGQGKGVPSSTPAVLKKEKDDDETDDVERVDYAKTMSDAYANLQNMLGDDGIKNLSRDTKDLMTQQKDLMKSFEGLGPMIKEAGGMMNSLKDLPDLGNLQNMMKSLHGAGKKQIKKK